MISTLKLVFRLLTSLYLIHDSSSQETTVPNNATLNPITCNLNFLKSYLLKGYAVSNSTDRFLICPEVNSNCCSKRDQMYIFHYLNDVLPQRVLNLNSKRNMIMMRFKRLHIRIMKTDLSFSGQTPKLNFCSGAGRSFINFDFKQMYSTYLRLHAAWTDDMLEYSRKYYCMLCDGLNHQFFKNEPSVALSEKFCMTRLKLYQKKAEFWSSTMMDYLTKLQNIVDCNHYENSFNIPFYNPNKVKEFKDVRDCLENLKGDFKLMCAKTCSKMGLASLTPYLDGDIAFLERTVIIFEKFNFNREQGQFQSIKLRKFNQKFEPLRKINLNGVDKTFRSIIEKAIKPEDITINPIDFLNAQIAIPRQLHLFDFETGVDNPKPAKDRRLSMKSLIKNQLRSRTPTVYELAHSIPSNSNSFFIGKSSSRHSDPTIARRLNKLDQFYQNGRRLQSISEKNPTDNFTSKRTPQIWVNSIDYMFYDQIAVQTDLPTTNLVFNVFMKPVNIDNCKKTITADGIDMIKYNSINTDILPSIFYDMVYNSRRVDVYNPKLAQIADSISGAFLSEMRECVNNDYSISAANIPLTTLQLQNLDQTPLEVSNRRLFRTIHTS